MQKKIQADFLGMVSSILCFVHCMLTPFLFLAQTCACCADGPLWWKGIDYVFLAIALLAVSSSTKNSSKQIMRIALYTAWSSLALCTILHHNAWISYGASWHYSSALTLFSLHLGQRLFGSPTCCNPNEASCQKKQISL